MNSISTHVLDVSLGCPAAKVSVELQFLRDGLFEVIAQGITNLDGRIVNWIPEFGLAEGQYQMRFDTAGYFEAIECREYFFPVIQICFDIADTQRNYHVPLLLSPFGYSTYRGS